jgi:hypothetical protein
LVDGDNYFQEAQDKLDEVGKGSMGVGMTPLIGGYCNQGPKGSL